MKPETPHHEGTLSENESPDVSDVRAVVRKQNPSEEGGFERQQAQDGHNASPKSPSIFRAVRAKCIDCAGGSWKYVKYCPSDGVNSLACPLWAFRFGVRPETARKRYGAEFLDPEAMPDGSTNLDDLP